MVFSAAHRGETKIPTAGVEWDSVRGILAAWLRQAREAGVCHTPQQTVQRVSCCWSLSLFSFHSFSIDFCVWERDRNQPCKHICDVSFVLYLRTIAKQGVICNFKHFPSRWSFYITHKNSVLKRRSRRTAWNTANSHLCPAEYCWAPTRTF